MANSTVAMCSYSPVAALGVCARVPLSARPASRTVRLHRQHGGRRGHLRTCRANKRALVTLVSASDSDSDSGLWTRIQQALPDWLPGWLTGKSDSEEYSKEMQKKMGSSLKYEHEKGIYYTHITDRLICGSCLQTEKDVDTIRDKDNVGTILCLQEDKDMAWWNLDIVPIQERAKERGDIVHVREPIRDFDPFSLRQRLPAVVKRLVQDMDANEGRAYVHCTAGMGRAPGVVLAHMWWVDGYTLEAAYDKLYSVRPCHPQLASIRAAACDILSGNMGEQEVTIRFKADGPAAVGVLQAMSTTEASNGSDGAEVEAGEAAKPEIAKVEIAGLNVGWDKRIELQLNESSGYYETKVELPIGKFVYKFVVNDDHWVADEENPTADDNGNLNNVVEVMPGPMDTEESERRTRLMAPEGDFTAAERQTLLAMLRAPEAEPKPEPVAL